MHLVSDANIPPDHDLCVAFAWILAAVLREQPLMTRARFAMMLLSLLHIGYRISEDEDAASEELDEEAVAMLRHQMANMPRQAH